MSHTKCNRAIWAFFCIANMFAFGLSAQVTNLNEEVVFRAPSQEQLKRLFNALVSQQPECVRAVCFTALKREAKSDEQLLADAKTEQQYFQSGKDKIPTDKDADLKAIVAREKARDDGLMYLWEKETKIKDAYRLDRTIYETATIPKVLSGSPTVETLRSFLIESSNHFETTIVSDEAKGRFYHFQINWRAGSSSYGDLQGTVPADRGLDSALYLPGELKLLLLAPFVRNTNSLSEEKFVREISDEKCAYKVTVVASNISGVDADRFQVRFRGAPSFPLIADFVCDRTNYNRLYSFTFYSMNGEVSWRQDRDYDASNTFPWLVKTRFHEGNSIKWTEELRKYVRVEYPYQIDREAVFGFRPPDSFSIENFSSGQSVIERYPLVSGKRLGPKNLVANQGDPQTQWQKPFVQGLLFILIIAVPIFFAVTKWLKESNK